MTKKVKCHDVWSIWFAQELLGESHESGSIQASVWNNWLTTPPDAVSARVRLSRQAQARAEELCKADAAKQKAETLLNELLTTEQKEDLKNNRMFYVESNGEMFRINRGFAGNVEKVDPVTKQAIEKYCIHPREKLPDADVMAAQKLMLEADVANFKKTANVTRLRN